MHVYNLIIALYEDLCYTNREYLKNEYVFIRDIQ